MKIKKNVIQQGGNVCSVLQIIWTSSLILGLLLCILCCFGSWGGLDKTIFNPDTFLGGTFDGIKIKNWTNFDKLNPATWFKDLGKIKLW
jgi:hypothetical protein